jgi:hypothetical protein
MVAFTATVLVAVKSTESGSGALSMAVRAALGIKASGSVHTSALVAGVWFEATAAMETNPNGAAIRAAWQDSM